jgi:hypothetical protein
MPGPDARFENGQQHAESVTAVELKQTDIVPKYPIFIGGHDVFVTKEQLELLKVDRAEPKE